MDRLNRINLNFPNSISKRYIIIIPPLIIGSYYLWKQLYCYFTVKNKSIETIYYDACDNSEISNGSNSITLNHSDSADGCAASIENRKIRSALLSTKCSYCRSNQKLSFRDSNIIQTSLKNLSSLQLIKLGLDNLNNVNRIFEKLKTKQINAKEIRIDITTFESKIENLDELLHTLITDLESLQQNDQLSSNNYISPEIDDDDFDDQASYISSTTTTSLGYWDPEPNLHFFEFYQEALQKVDSIRPPKTDRTIVTGCEDYNDFLAKVHCLRKAFALLFQDEKLCNRFAKIGEDILRTILDHSLRDSNECIKAYYAFINYVLDEKNHTSIEIEMEPRKIAMFSFYDIVLDYMIMESFDDLENPPTAVKSIISNRWLSASFREVALQTTVSTVMRRKRSKLILKNGFFEHFYSILDHLSPILAWGFLGTDDDLKFKCETFKDSTQAVIKDYFSFDRCRYTYVQDLCEDIKRVTEERLWEWENKLKIIQS
ncbi:hypothetical protein SSS_10037 [Sarcoptes scabiei]|nr:hypothetical protein SSS_10037 [Sarcoptes scabiei]UXI19569.1 putative short-chain dehydrogenase/reductase Mc1 [Sarcoptes scabiei]